MPKVSLLVIVGPTASGKSGLAMRVAQTHHGQIIAADSRTIYRGMDLGTAKPTIQDQADVKHHMLDVVDPTSVFSAADFQREAFEIIHDIKQAAFLPIMVGGSGLNVDSVIFNYDFKQNKPLLPLLELRDLSLEELQALAKAENLDVSEQTWRNPRHLAGLIARGGENGARQATPDPETLIVGLNPPQPELHARIEQRIHEMFINGLEQEVRQLAEQYGWDAPGLQAIGYQEFKDAIAEEAQAKIIQNTKAYAKRQLTWFKRNPSIQWFAEPNAAYDFVVQNLKN